MTLILLIWITSWIGGVLLLNENLPKSLTFDVNPTGNIASFSNLANHNPLLISSNKQTKEWKIILLPTNAFNLDWMFIESSRKSPNTEPIKGKNGENQLYAQKQNPSSVEPQYHLMANFMPMILNQSNTQMDDYPNKIFQSLQNLFGLINNSAEKSADSASTLVLVIKRHRYNYEVWVNNKLVANFPDRITATSLQKQLQQLISSPHFDPTQLRPSLVDGTPALMDGNRFLFSIDQQISSQLNRSGELLAIEWTNNLRVALQVPPLDIIQAKMELYELKPTENKITGTASWYGGYFHGRLTANGERYNQDDLTVAHRSLPFNTYLQVTNLQNGKSVIVRVNDRGPYISPRSLDLSREAARRLDSQTTGVVPYEAVILQPKVRTMILTKS
ncbi:septal ring lytic transglycosylase RlpA family protein [Cronbergia sp. UHCC 0137]|uniref:septal ring lytic transglycosylase RlpA family protein n=1 Tax=Cronbergia sp. UHCC 0137 TaxID=3110239 RepID=UPI002B1F3AF4|nr:septal ring lytic transglycosylase RlpA family protein [Cronbergia sp. UHCC 0137]MEA5619753.1 septal ring lytic transglycosylase RlpA family protein [Cronbergia sp. UHCC 0137]